MALPSMLSAFIFATTCLAKQSELSLSCGATGACDEFEVELAEEELAAEMQVELLQRMPVDIKLAASGTVAKVASTVAAIEGASSKACLVDHLVGSWKVENALGIDGVTVKLQVGPRGSSECDSVSGVIHYLGKTTEYSITAAQNGEGKLNVKYLNDKASPTYFHEGEFDVGKDTMTEDLGAVNGVRQNDNMLLRFTRSF
eukprot:TRINITY_DN20508_c0_g1_i1.p1 TRINITY_DN20508_c0_g1~~TRINITY_DN20508_c0_g1_i1.p1  ORF type:complete len:200 (+),score=51.15 TRINITY_DN20508_c0_g1_i1:132-731(+)